MSQQLLERSGVLGNMEQSGARDMSGAADMIGRAYDDGLPESGSVTLRDDTVAWRGANDTENRRRAAQMIKAGVSAGATVLTRGPGESDFTAVRRGAQIKAETEIVPAMAGG